MGFKGTWCFSTGRTAPSLGLLSRGAKSLGVLGCRGDKKPCENCRDILQDIDGNSVILTDQVDKDDEKNLNIRRQVGDFDYDKSETHLLIRYSIVRTQSCRQDKRNK